MDYLYSLYDALVSINVPNDRARAVVDAMERDMGTTLTTKADLNEHRLATRADLAEARAEFRTGLAGLKAELEAGLTRLRSEAKADVAGLKSELKSDIALVRQDLTLQRKDMEMLSNAVTFRVSSVVVVCLGIFFAALKFTS